MLIRGRAIVDLEIELDDDEVDDLIDICLDKFDFERLRSDLLIHAEEKMEEDLKDTGTVVDVRFSFSALRELVDIREEFKKE